MKLDRSTLLLPVLAALAAAPALSQSDEPDGTPTPTEDKLVFAKLELGGTAVIQHTDGTRLGVPRNHVIDRRTGRVAAIVIELGFEGDEGHKQVAVPYERFAWNMEERSLLLPMQPEELAVLPVFDPAMIQTVGARNAAVEAVSSDGAHVRNLASADLVGTELLGAEELFGAVTDLLLDPQRGQIAFLIVEGAVPSAHGLRYVIPWTATEWKAPTDPDSQRGSLLVPMTVAELAEAPKLERGSIRALEDPKTVAHIYRFYGIERPMSAVATESHRTSG
jgi:sporulation protein YlmC with PRC-barrel domain